MDNNSNTNSLQDNAQPFYDEESAGNPVFTVEKYDPDKPYISIEHINQQSHEEDAEGNNPENPILIVEDSEGNPGSEIEPYSPGVILIESDDESNYGYSLFL
jgi:hypothetical protein